MALRICGFPRFCLDKERRHEGPGDDGRRQQRRHIHQRLGRGSWKLSPRNGDVHAFLWTEVGGFQDLGTLGGTGSYAYGINKSGEVVGYSLLADGTTYHAFLWTQAVGMQDLGTLGDGTSSIALAVGTSGRVLGYA